MNLTVRDLMSRNIVSVTPDTFLVDAAEKLVKHNYSNLPVISNDGALDGVINERDFITEPSYLHLRTLLRLFNGIDLYRDDSSDIKKDLNKLLKLKVSQVMNKACPSVPLDCGVEEVVKLFSDPKTGLVAVVDDLRKVVGVVTVSDLTKLYGVGIRNNLRSTMVEKDVEEFIDNFEKKFIVMKKWRKDYWLAVSILFAFVGFVIALMLIVRVNII